MLHKIKPKPDQIPEVVKYSFVIPICTLSSVDTVDIQQIANKNSDFHYMSKLVQVDVENGRSK